jgi:glycosyltransferase involved in cell wall biosynthesis
MRILTICGDRGIPAFGRKGASTHLREMIGGLRAGGNEVILAAANLEGDRRADENFPTVTWELPTSRLIGSDGRAILSSSRSRRMLRAAIKEHRPDVIYERLALYYTAGAEIADLTGLPRLLEVNALLSEEQATRVHLPEVAARVERRVLLGATGIAAISEIMRERLVEIGVPSDRIRVFSMAVNPARFVPTGAGPALRAQAGLRPDAIVLGFVGSMNHYHKPKLFRRLLKKLLPENDRLAGVFVGGSESKVDRLEDQLDSFVQAKRVHFEGTVPQEALSGWMEAMDLIVVPGAAPQSTPTKIFEAAALGRPILLPDTVPIRTLCRGGAEALMFAEDSIDSLVDAVQRWLADPRPVAEALAVLRERVLRDHTWEGEARRLTAWFGELRGGS